MWRIRDSLVEVLPSLTTERFCRDVKFLSHFERLHTVILDHNRLDCMSTLPVLPRLRVLWLNFNRLLSATLFVPSLARSCPGLRVLCLMGNELAPSYLTGGTSQQNANYRYARKGWLTETKVTNVTKRDAIGSR